MVGNSQRNQQLPPGSGNVSNLIMRDGQRANEHDWTEDLPKTDHVRFFRDTDWSKTSLGPLNTWSPTLRLFTGFVLADSRAACLWWYVNGQLSKRMILKSVSATSSRPQLTLSGAKI